MTIFFTMVTKRKEHSNDLRSFTSRQALSEWRNFSEKSRRKHCFHKKQCGISLTSTKEPNALETCLVEIERGRPQQQLTEQLGVY